MLSLNDVNMNNRIMIRSECSERSKNRLYFFIEMHTYFLLLPFGQFERLVQRLTGYMRILLSPCIARVERTRKAAFYSLAINSLVSHCTVRKIDLSIKKGN